MYFVSVTRLRLRSFIHLLPFFLANERSVKQLLITPGFIAGKELVDKGMVFWTVTLWAADTDMKAFRNSEAHRKAMQKLPTWCSEATYVHWVQEDATLPSWPAVHEKMLTEGKISKVRNPTERHLVKDFPPPQRTKTERPFKPRTHS